MTADATGQTDDVRILLAHGGGGELTKKLIEQHIIPQLGNDVLNPLQDSAVLAELSGVPCFTTDSFVVTPLEFPGGDIGRLAVCGTVNDLAVMGAEPVALSLALIIEEGLPLATLDRVVASIGRAAKEAGVDVVTGDTKVIEHRGGDGMFITTAGLGQRSEARCDLSRVVSGDAILITGTIAEHGLAVMSAREGLAFETDIRSDVAPLNGLVAALLSSGADVKFMRDPTRGGLAGVLVDLCEETGLTVEVREQDIPITTAAYHASEMLGLDPLTVANEGKCVVVVGAPDVERALAACREHPLGRRTAWIGRFTQDGAALVELLSRSGGRRIVQRPYGEDLPRIC